MYAEERQRQIADQARRDGRVEVARLAEDLDVTPETIRRDLTRLERLGQLKRVHGGAIPLTHLAFEAPVADRDSTMAEEKDRIAAAALKELPKSGAILLDAGTTTRRLAANLPSDRELTVVTNALDIASTLAEQPNVTVLMIGGRVRGRTMAAVDGHAESMLRNLYVDVAFVATNGVSLERGLTTPDSDEAAMKRLMIAQARRVVLLADHTKVADDHLVRFGDLDDIDTFITDRGLDPRLQEDLLRTGLRVVAA